VGDAAEQGFQGRWSIASPREFCLIVCYSVWPTEQHAGRRLGARVPIILTPRADSVRSRMASCAAAVLYAHARRGAATLPAA